MTPHAHICDAVRTPVGRHGGAIALGYALRASGARLASTAVKPLHATGGRYALGTMCLGVGQGIAVMLERVRVSRPWRATTSR